MNTYLEYWDTKPLRVSDALRMARETGPQDPSITCFRICPVMMAEVTPDPEPEAIEVADQ